MFLNPTFTPSSACPRKIAAQLPEAARCRLEAILQRSVNVLSFVYPHVYFPAYSSSLKEIGKHLGCANLKLEATGLQSIIWRTEWEAERNAELKAKLVDYNRTDCLALRKLTEFILSNTASTTSGEENEAKVKHTDEIQKAHVSQFRWRAVEQQQRRACDQKIRKVSAQRGRVLYRTLIEGVLGVGQRS